jgi:hypothetical protein
MHGGSAAVMNLLPLFLTSGSLTSSPSSVEKCGSCYILGALIFRKLQSTILHNQYNTIKKTTPSQETIHNSFYSQMITKLHVENYKYVMDSLIKLI